MPISPCAFGVRQQRLDAERLRLELARPRFGARGVHVGAPDEIEDLKRLTRLKIERADVSAADDADVDLGGHDEC